MEPSQHNNAPPDSCPQLEPPQAPHDAAQHVLPGVDGKDSSVETPRAQFGSGIGSDPGGGGEALALAKMTRIRRTFIVYVHSFNGSIPSTLKLGPVRSERSKSEPWV